MPTGIGGMCRMPVTVGHFFDFQIKQTRRVYAGTGPLGYGFSDG